MVRTAAFSASLMVLLLLASTLIFYSPHTVAATTSPRILLLDLGTPEAAGALQLINMSFVKVSSSQFLTTDLNMFDLLFVGWDGNFATNPAAFAALTTRQGDIANWVASGHGVVALAEPNIGHFTWLPLSVNITEENADPVAITNPSHPVMANLTDALLSGWGNSYHNYFTSWNTAYQVLATTPLHGLPVTLAATLGSGRIAITGQDPDWHLFNQGRPGAAILLRNMVKWAGGVSQTVLKNTSLSVSPIVSTVSKGSSFSVGINVANVSNLYSFRVIVTFDPSLLTASPPTDFGNVLRNYCSKTSGCSGVSSQFTSGPGFVEGNESLVGTVPGFTGNGTVYTVQLTAAKGGAGTSAIHIASNASGGGNGNLASATGLAIQHFSIDGIFSDDGPDLFVSIVPNLLSLGSGATATSRVTLYSLNGLTGTVALSLSGVPAGVSGVLGQTALSLNGTSASTTLKITVGATVVAGTSPVTITGTITLKAQTIARSSSLQLTILSAPPDFSISVTRASVVIPVGGAGSVNVTVTSVNGFNAPITLSLQGLALGGEATSAFNIDPVTPAAGSSASSKLTIFVSQFAFPATIPLTVTGASAGLTHTA